jgi:signal transduction histidine kinase
VDLAERVLVTSNGERVPVVKTVVAAQWKGRSYLIESFIDISGWKRAHQRQVDLVQQMENANKELTDFAHVVSHDLKAPLRGIKTLAGWIAADSADKLDQEGREQLSLLLSRVTRMEDLINGILQYSRAGRPTEEGQGMVDLGEVVPSIVDMVACLPHVTVSIEGPLPQVRADKTRMSQVFQNLLSNAVKFKDKPECLIRIGCVDDGEFWRFSVSDNGPGIEDKYFEKIFMLFQTLAPRDDFESSGVGLAVVKKIVAFYGGRVCVESKVGQGSTFFFTFPKAKGPVQTLR